MDTFFSKNAVMLLKQRHIRQKDFCEQLGCGKSNWSNIVKTKNLETLSKIANILEMNLDDVIGFNRQKFILSGFVKINSKIYEVKKKEDLKILVEILEQLESTESLR